MRNLKDSVSDNVNSGSFGTSNGLVIATNRERNSFFVQNLHTGVLYLKLGAGASNTSFNVALKACTVQDDGNGGTYSNDKWIGDVSVSGVFTKYVAWELI